MGEGVGEEEGTRGRGTLYEGYGTQVQPGYRCSLLEFEIWLLGRAT